MRLLRCKEGGNFEFTKNLPEGALPKYAILSHTWLADEEEVEFKELSSGVTTLMEAKTGYNKIKFCGEQAARDGLDHFWVDTCCINRESATELQEAITSMFTWYRNAVKCYVYLTDISVVAESKDVDCEDESHTLPWDLSFRNSRWFTRGWTLQELLAPPNHQRHYI